ncbi:MAG: adenine methyltransferase [Candidatus Wallbacteria bacterium]|nr:adenine methyltransferase [Candidatus Wallbacteria bacterium]
MLTSPEIRVAQHFVTSGRTEYLTPRYILEAVGPFDLDPCASVVRPWPTATRHYTIENDGLVQPWDGLCWVNPPFGKAEAAFVRKLATHPAGGILLGCPSKTETRTWQIAIFPHCSGILFLTPRLKFHNTDGSAMSGTFGASCLVAFGDVALERLRTAARLGPGRVGGLGGYVVILDDQVEGGSA